MHTVHSTLELRKDIRSDRTLTSEAVISVEAVISDVELAFAAAGFLLALSSSKTTAGIGICILGINIFFSGPPVLSSPLSLAPAFAPLSLAPLSTTPAIATIATIATIAAIAAPAIATIAAIAAKAAKPEATLDVSVLLFHFFDERASADSAFTAVSTIRSMPHLVGPGLGMKRYFFDRD